MNIQLSDAKLTRRYFERRAKAMIGLEPQFLLGKAILGSGYVTDVNGEPTVHIPDDASEVIGGFLHVDPIYTYANGRILIRAVVPKGAIQDGQQKQFTSLNILDDHGGVVAIFASTPIWLHSGRSLGLDGYIETNIA